jgi:hypothetical protein
MGPLIKSLELGVREVVAIPYTFFVRSIRLGPKVDNGLWRQWHAHLSQPAILFDSME